MTTFVLAQRDPMNEKSTYPPYNSTVFFRSGEIIFYLFGLNSFYY